jgi:hypothetical protein
LEILLHTSNHGNRELQTRLDYSITFDWYFERLYDSNAVFTATLWCNPYWSWECWELQNLAIGGLAMERIHLFLWL